MLNNKVVRNASWVIGCRVVQMALSFLVSTLTARYLGPANFGTINYAKSLVAFVGPVMSLGLSAILVQEIVKNPEKEGEALGTSMGLSLLSGLACIVGLFAFTSITSHDEPVTRIVCALYSVTLLVQALETIQYWFQAKLRSAYMAVVSVLAYVVTSAYRLYLLATGKSVAWFALSNAFDYAIIAMALIVIYYKVGTQKLSFSWARAKEMLAVSKYYIVSSLMINVFSQTDKLMLKHMIDETSVGIYSAAVNCAGLTGFVFVALIDSIRPSIFAAKKVSQENFERNMKITYAVIIYMALLQSLGISLFSKTITGIIYGDGYGGAATVLQVLVWYTTFSYLGAVRSIWILAEGKQKYLWIINLSGAVANVVLNLTIIPLWGALGAAVASLITQIFTNVIIGFIMKPIRGNNRLMIQSLNPKLLGQFVNSLKKKRGGDEDNGETEGTP